MDELSKADRTFISALYREHCASPDGYQPPTEVAAARKATSDLIDRTEGRARTRDERRLLGRYKSTQTAHDAALVDRWFPEAAPTNGEDS